MPDLFKYEPREGGYQFVTAPGFPGFSAMLEPGEPITIDHYHALMMLVVLDEREACARIADEYAIECSYERQWSFAREIAAKIRDRTVV